MCSNVVMSMHCVTAALETSGTNSFLNVLALLHRNVLLIVTLLHRIYTILYTESLLHH